MNIDIGCVGVCIIDPDTGACLGCGRLPEEIAGVPQPRAPAIAKPVPLPANVAAAAGEPVD